MATQDFVVDPKYKEKLKKCCEDVEGLSETQLCIWLHLVITTIDNAIETESVKQTGHVTVNFTSDLIKKFEEFVLLKGRRKKISPRTRSIIFIAIAQVYWLSIVIRNGEVEKGELGENIREVIKHKTILPAEIPYGIYEYSLYDVQFSLLDFCKKSKSAFWTEDHGKVLAAMKNKCYMLSMSSYKDADPKRLDNFDAPVFIKKSQSSYYTRDDISPENGSTWIPSDFMIAFFERFMYHLSFKEAVFKTFPYRKQSETFRPPIQFVSALVQAIKEKSMDHDIEKNIDKVACKKVTKWLCTKLERENFAEGKVLEDESNTRRALESQNAEALTDTLRYCLKNGSGVVSIFSKKLKESTVEQLINVSEEDILCSKIFVLVFEVWAAAFMEKVVFNVKDYIKSYTKLDLPFCVNKEIAEREVPFVIRLPHGWGVWDNEAKEILVYKSIFEAMTVWILAIECCVETNSSISLLWEGGLGELKRFLERGTQWEKIPDLFLEDAIPFYLKKRN